VLLCIAHDPGVRLRDIAARTGITGRTAYSIVTDLTEAGYVVKHKEAAATHCTDQTDLFIRTEPVQQAAVFLGFDCPARGHRIRGALRAVACDRLPRP
jgi:hypothetical protein